MIPNTDFCPRERRKTPKDNKSTWKNGTSAVNTATAVNNSAGSSVSAATSVGTTPVVYGVSGSTQGGITANTVNTSASSVGSSVPPPTLSAVNATSVTAGSASTVSAGATSSNAYGYGDTSASNSVSTGAATGAAMSSSNSASSAEYKPKVPTSPTATYNKLFKCKFEDQMDNDDGDKDEYLADADEPARATGTDVDHGKSTSVFDSDDNSYLNDHIRKLIIEQPHADEENNDNDDLLEDEILGT